MKKKNLLFTIISILGIATATMAQVPNYVPTNGLVGFWPFTGNANDLSVNNNNGTVNSALLTSDRLGNANCAYYFNGTSSSISLGTSSLINGITNDFSVSMWINVEADGVGISSWGGSGWRFINRINANGVITFDLNIPGQGYVDGWAILPTPTNSYTINNWFYFTFIRNGANGTIYVNGINKGSTTMTGSITTANDAITFLGRSAYLPQGLFFKGKLDDIGIWNRVLSECEIQHLFSNSISSITTQPTNQIENINNNVKFITILPDPTATYQWQTNIGLGFQNLSNAGQYTGATNDTLTVSNLTLANNNQQFRCVINAGVCNDTSNTAILTVINYVGINEANKNIFSFYPNPTTGLVNIKGCNIEKVYLSDITGKILSTINCNTDKMQIDLSPYAKGVYFIKLVSGENVRVEKVELQ